VLHNISQEIVKRNKAGEVCQGKDHRTYMLLCSNRPVEFRQSVRHICNEIIAQMNQIMHLEVNIGLGSYETELENIYKSY
ncbi:DNA-binding response regulator, partial [Klebsiella oxytoca]